jgi:hypothetical protein
MSAQASFTFGGLDLHVPTFGEMVGSSGAFLSDDRRYRYALWRVWGEGPPALFIGLNPSTADEHANDPTIRRCIGFARLWGCGGLLMANLYAWRATKPRTLEDVDRVISEDQQLVPVSFDPAGLPAMRNDLVTLALAHAAKITIACWGAWPGPCKNRPDNVRALLATAGDLHVLGRTADGAPRHPLYMRADTRPERWPA